MSVQQQVDVGPDETLSAIYGTNGAEKIASINNPNNAATLSDLALAFAIDVVGEDEDIEKVASVHQQLHQEFIEMDRAGRASAHAQINDLEKLAAEGDEEPLLQYLYSDMVDENGQPVLDAEPAPAAEETELSPVQLAILAEVNRRLQQG